MSENARVVAVHVDPDDQTESLLGELIVAADGQLRLVAAAPATLDFLDGLVESLNAKDSVNLKGPGEEKYALSAEEHKRTDAGFVDALKRYLGQFYSIELRDPRDFAAVGNADDLAA